MRCGVCGFDGYKTAIKLTQHPEMLLTMTMPYWEGASHLRTAQQAMNWTSSYQVTFLVLTWGVTPLCSCGYLCEITRLFESRFWCWRRSRLDCRLRCWRRSRHSFRSQCGRRSRLDCRQRCGRRSRHSFRWQCGRRSRLDCRLWCYNRSFDSRWGCQILSRFESGWCYRTRPSRIRSWLQCWHWSWCKCFLRRTITYFLSGGIFSQALTTSRGACIRLKDFFYKDISCTHTLPCRQWFLLHICGMCSYPSLPEPLRQDIFCTWSHWSHLLRHPSFHMGIPCIYMCLLCRHMFLLHICGIRSCPKATDDILDVL